MAKRSKYTSRHITATVIALLAIVAGGAGWLYLRDWKSTARTQLTEGIAKASNGLYQLDYTDIAVNVLRGDLSLKNVTLSTDSSRYQQLIKQEKAPDSRFHAGIAELRVRGVSIWQVLASKKLSITEIALHDADLHILQQPHAYNDTTKRDSIDFYSKIKNTFQAIDVGTLQVTPLRLQHSRIRSRDTVATTIDSIQIQVTDFLINAETAQDSSRLLYSEAIVVKIPNFSYDIAGSPYKVTLERLTLKSKEQTAIISKAALLPNMSKSQYFQNDKENKALITLQLDSVLLEEFDLRKFTERGLLHAKYAHINGGSALFEKDKRYQEDNVNKIGEAPHQQVMKLEQLLRVDTIFVQGVDIAYQEYSAKYEQVGRISFDKAQGQITNLSNDPAWLGQDQFMRADLRANLMGTGVLHAIFGFDMLSKSGAHSYKGSLGRMQADRFNGITGPLLALEFETGTIQHIDFDIQATDHKHWGEFRFRYSDFNINILNKPKAGEESSTKDVLSFLVNQLLLNNSNPDREGNFRIGQINHSRVPVYSHFKSIWKALFDGIQQSVGLAKAEEVVDELPDSSANDHEKNILQRTGDFFKGLFSKPDANEDASQNNK